MQGNAVLFLSLSLHSSELKDESKRLTDASKVLFRDSLALREEVAKLRSELQNFLAKNSRQKALSSDLC